MTDINEFIKQVKTLQEDNARLKLSVERYSEHANKLIEITATLKEIAKDLSPYTSLGGSLGTSRAPRKDYTDILQEVSNKLLAGVQFSATQLSKLYSLSPTDAGYLILLIRRSVVGIKKRREGRQVFYYV